MNKSPKQCIAALLGVVAIGSGSAALWGPVTTYSVLGVVAFALALAGWLALCYWASTATAKGLRHALAFDGTRNHVRITGAAEGDYTARIVRTYPDGRLGLDTGGEVLGARGLWP